MEASGLGRIQLEVWQRETLRLAGGGSSSSRGDLVEKRSRGSHLNSDMAKEKYWQGEEIPEMG